MRGEREVSKGITARKGRCGGKPCIAGTRFTAEHAAAILAIPGEGDEILLENYHFIGPHDIANVRGWDRKGRPS